METIVLSNFNATVLTVKFSVTAFLKLNNLHLSMVYYSNIYRTRTIKQTRLGNNPDNMKEASVREN